MYYFISNPTSGRSVKQGKKSVGNIVKHYLDENKIEYQWFESEYFRHPIEIARDITRNNESGNIVIIGGDGTFNEVLNGMSNISNWNIGLIPAGSGNDFAANIGLSKKRPLEALKKILDGKISKTDYIKVNDSVCLNVLGTGIDVAVLENFEKYGKLRGKFRYFVALLSTLCHFDWYEFDVSLDGKEFVHKKGFITALCNGSTIGGGIPICPSALANDNKLDFVFVNQIPKIKILGYLITLMRGKILECKVAEHCLCEKAVFKSDSEFIIQIDGNIDNMEKEYRCEIVKNGINLYR